uniref:TF-B3 domain-containing protein n=1 Tax=Chenopodium quinoa TaxID=63459 RepID=A0A803LT84_CHEQI
MDSGAHRRHRIMERSSRDRGSSSQQESIKKPAQLELLFCKELQKQDTTGFCSLADEYGSIFLAEQDRSGHVLFIDIQSKKVWGFYLEFSEDQSDYKYKFGKGWLQFAQAKGLTVGDSVTFYRQRATDLFFIDCLPKEPSVLDQISSSNQTTLTLLFDSPFLHYLSLFPEDHEIKRDTWIQLGQAAGLFADASLASIASSFEVYQSEGYLYPSRYDETTGKLWYKVTDLVPNHVTNSERTHLKIDLDVPLDSLCCEKSKFEHVTMWSFPSNVIPVLEKFINLRTLWFLNGHRSCVNHVPYDFFTSLKHLQILNLSCTKITELPCSIGHVRGLRYFDLSETLVKNLPETVCHLKELQTLKLKNCCGLITLPKDTTRLEKLQHLHLGVHTYLHCMPPWPWCTYSPLYIVAIRHWLQGSRPKHQGTAEEPGAQVDRKSAELTTRLLSACGRTQTSNTSRIIEHNDGIDDKVAFPKLKKFALISLLSLEEWKDVHKSDFPSLLKLELKDCPQLVTICSLSDMHSLQHLEISNCPLLQSLPEGRLPASVEELLIEDCPLLKHSCSKPDGEDWHKIEHVGSIWIDFEGISSR